MRRRGFLSTVLVFAMLIATLRSSDQGQANQSPSQSALQPTTPPSPSGSAVTDQQQELAVLRAQLETIKQYDQRMETIVLWSLGLVVLVGFALIAGSWYTNKTVTARDRAEIQTALETELRARIGDIERTQNEARKLLAQELQAELQQIQKQASSSVSSEIKTLQDRIAKAEMCNDASGSGRR